MAWNQRDAVSDIHEYLHQTICLKAIGGGNPYACGITADATLRQVGRTPCRSYVQYPALAHPIRLGALALHGIPDDLYSYLRGTSCKSVSLNN